MNQFIINAATILKSISNNTDFNSALIGKNWVFADDKNDDEKYHFHENNELIIEKDNKKINAKWNFQKATNNLQINKDEIITYKILFFDKAVVVLQKDDSKTALCFLANKAILTDLNIEKHLRDIVYKHLHISLVHVTAGFDLEIHRSHSEETIGANGQIVSLNLATVKDGFYQSSNSNFIYEIINSKIAHKKHVYKLLLSDGTQANLYSENKTAVVSVGDNIVVNQNPINDGKYFTADTWFVISSGKIQKSGDLKKHKTKNGVLLIEQQGVKQMPGDLAFFENGEPLNSEISIGLFAKIKGVNGKIV